MTLVNPRISGGTLTSTDGDDVKDDDGDGDDNDDEGSARGGCGSGCLPPQKDGNHLSGKARSL